MKARTTMKTMLLCVLISTMGVWPAMAQTSSTIELEQAVHFFTPGGDDVVIGPGTLGVEVAENWLQFTPIGAEKTEAVLIQTQKGQHEETLQEAKALSVSDGEGLHRVALLLTKGLSLEAVGSSSGGPFSGVQIRDVSNSEYVEVVPIADLSSNTQGPGKKALNRMNTDISTMTGIGNTATGYWALRETYHGNNNTAVGAEALRNNVAGHSNTAMGYQALNLNTAGFNTAMGAAALLSNTTGQANTAMGVNSLRANKIGTNNTAVGNNSLMTNTEGKNNTASGFMALSSNTKGSQNTAMGTVALNKNTTGSHNTAMGFGALANNTIGRENTAMGHEALSANEGIRNTATGFHALRKNTKGQGNIANGFMSLSRNTEGSRNIAIGNFALMYNEGTDNVAIGGGALLNNESGLRNIAMGRVALAHNKNGDFNIAIGHYAGYKNETGGDRNIYVGNQGANESNTIRIGTDGEQTRTFLAGIRGVTTDMADAVTVVIDSTGQLGTVSSSRRFKEDIRDMAEASSKLNQLRPVTFRYKKASTDGAQPQQYGLIAEEVAEVYPDLVVYGADGKVETVQYRKLTTMLLNELQKQHQKTLIQAKQIAELRVQVTVVQTQNQQLQEFQARLAKLEAHSSVVPVTLH